MGSPERIQNELVVEKCFSIIFHQEKSVDLMVVDDSIITREELVNHMERLIDMYHNQKRFVSKDVLLLRCVWNESDKVSFI